VGHFRRLSAAGFQATAGKSKKAELRYPTRHQSHVTETASFKRLDSCIPSHWIIRHVSERDYGVDCMVEPVRRPGGPVVGDLLAIQLKGTKILNWSPHDDFGFARATFSGVDTATVNYWMRLPVPVFLCVHEQESNALYFVGVKNQVRRRYKETRTQRTFGFELSTARDLSRPESHGLLYAMYLHECARTAFASALTDLLVNRDSLVKYITGNVQRDEFMEVETSELVRLSRLYSNVKTVADFTDIAWTLPTLDDFIQQDEQVFKDRYAIMHELTHDKVLRGLAPLLIAALRKACDVIAKLEHDYWLENEPLLVYFITSNGADAWVAETEESLKWVLPTK
jgi:Domain of unknown function (DUF4365)